MLPLVTTMFTLPALALLVVFLTSTWGTDSMPVSTLFAEALCFGFLGGLPMFLWFWKSVERGEIFFWWRGCISWASPNFWCVRFYIRRSSYINWRKRYFFGIAFTYVGLHTSTDAKDIFWNCKNKKKILSHGDVKQVSRRRFVSVFKNQRIHTTTPWQNLHRHLVRRRPPPRKKTVSITGHFGFFLIYFMRLRYCVKGSIAFLLSFYDRCCRDTQTIDVLLMLFLFSLHQKAPPLSPMTSVGSATLMLTATSSLLSLKGSLTPPSFLSSSSLSSSIVKSTRQLFVETPRKSTRLPLHFIN